MYLVKYNGISIIMVHTLHWVILCGYYFFFKVIQWAGTPCTVTFSVSNTIMKYVLLMSLMEKLISEPFSVRNWLSVVS